MNVELNDEIYYERKKSKEKLIEIKSELVDLENCNEFIQLKIYLRKYRQEFSEITKHKDDSIQSMNDELKRLHFLYDNFSDQQVSSYLSISLKYE